MPAGWVAEESHRFLLQAVTESVDATRSMAERREHLVKAIGARIRADAGHWAFGRGNPERGTLAVVAHLPFGFSPRNLAGIQAFGMSEVAMREFQVPQFAHLRPDGVIACVRRSILSDAQWTRKHPLRRAFLECGQDEWLNVVRFSNDDTWSQFFLLRSPDQPAFSEEDLELVDRAMGGISWLWAATSEAPTRQEIDGLTPRRRTVLLRLLSGQSRKAIAHQLGISETTVNDHVNALFDHFGVRSVSELAAVFLRGL